MDIAVIHTSVAQFRLSTSTLASNPVWIAAGWGCRPKSVNLDPLSVDFIDDYSIDRSIQRATFELFDRQIGCRFSNLSVWTFMILG
jgi:hypothetical protein